MTSRFDARISVLAILLVVGGSLAVAGAATAQSGNGFDVTVDFPSEFVADHDQTIDVNVENTEDTDLVSPLIEIPLGSNYDINKSSIGDDSISVDGETRNSYINDSTYRSGDALFIEGVSVPAGETNSYEVGIDVDSAITTNVRVDVRPLNRESNNDRGTYSEDALGFGDIEVDFGGSTNAVTIDGTSTDVSGSGALTQEVIADRPYTVGADISILDSNLEITGVSPEIANTETVWFNDVATAGNPAIVGHTEADADILNPTSRTVRGNAETATKQAVEYSLQTNGGNTYLVINDTTALDPWTETVEFEIDDGSITELQNTDGVTLVNVSVDTDTDGSFEFIGYPVGDVDESSDVTSTDAKTIAQAAADGQLGSINDYGDVTDSGSSSVVDAMYIQQYLDGNRDADYDQTGGN